MNTSGCRALPSRRGRATRRDLVTLSSLLLVGALCAAAEPSPSPAGPVVALAGVEVAGGVEDPAPLAAKVETALATLLRERGFEIVPSERFQASWQRRLQEAHGYYDIVSGRPDLAKRRALRAAALGEIRQESGARVLLQPSLVVVRAGFVHGKAAWDGATETAAPTGSGELPALSLSLQVEDLGGGEVSSSRAGIQLLAKYSLWNSKYGPVPREKLLADDARLNEAVGRALAPLLDAVRSAPATIERTASAAAEAPSEPAPEPPIVAPPPGSKVVALRALSPAQDGIVVPPEVEARCLLRLRARLEEAGFRVLPPDVFDRTIRAIALERGGLYDPITGRRDDEKLGAALRETRRRLTVEYRSQALLTAGIALRSARFSGENAVWDGVTEKVADIAAWKKALVTTRGTTTALSFGIVVEDANGTQQYAGWGGIQLVDRLEKDRFVRIPASELFRDPSRDEQAVDLALRGWLNVQAGPPALTGP